MNKKKKQIWDEWNNFFKSEEEKERSGMKRQYKRVNPKKL